MPKDSRSLKGLPQALVPIFLWFARSSATDCAPASDPPTKFTVDEDVWSFTESYNLVDVNNDNVFATVVGELPSFHHKEVSYIADDGTTVASARKPWFGNNVEFFDCSGDKIAEISIPDSASVAGEVLIDNTPEAEVYSTVQGPWWARERMVTFNALDKAAGSLGTLLTRLSQRKSGLAHGTEIEILTNSLPNATIAAQIEAAGVAGRRLQSADQLRQASADPVILALFSALSYSEAEVLASWRLLVALPAIFLASCFGACLVLCALPSCMDRASELCGRRDSFQLLRGEESPVAAIDLAAGKREPIAVYAETPSTCAPGKDDDSFAFGVGSPADSKRATLAQGRPSSAEEDAERKKRIEDLRRRKEEFQRQKSRDQEQEQEKQRAAKEQKERAAAEARRRREEEAEEKQRAAKEKKEKEAAEARRRREEEAEEKSRREAEERERREAAEAAARLEAEQRALQEAEKQEKERLAAEHAAEQARQEEEQQRLREEEGRRQAAEEEARLEEARRRAEQEELQLAQAREKAEQEAEEERRQLREAQRAAEEERQELERARQQADRERKELEEERQRTAAARQRAELGGGGLAGGDAELEEERRRMAAARQRAEQEESRLQQLAASRGARSPSSSQGAPRTPPRSAPAEEAQEAAAAHDAGEVSFPEPEPFMMMPASPEPQQLEWERPEDHEAEQPPAAGPGPAAAQRREEQQSQATPRADSARAGRARAESVGTVYSDDSGGTLYDQASARPRADNLPNIGTTVEDRDGFRPRRQVQM